MIELIVYVSAVYIMLAFLAYVILYAILYYSNNFKQKDLFILSILWPLTIIISIIAVIFKGIKLFPSVFKNISDKSSS